ncbi:orotidine-5'-phosphate decarboxylase [Thermanaeromonas toyohensis ToBE]|uniref:Orotidine 5'-phosphate decarboxylase n=1 Tax=Thermanaeromonas toyohensis ToBE TaxID=698762 RepID=A0A1W1VMI4_9FIRM|nr:orotidine-5'-phosphate decarboxylase [Thermanaeromonas toyohensis]SMB94536.1 orotidine-5'-phosphate decarboxylase [Thermanaeromonas toyohensis ToBE]
MSTTHKSAKDRLIVALDVPELARAQEIVEKLAPFVGMFKVGLELYSVAGPAALKIIKERGGRVFADLKFHDIPNTVAGAVRALVRHGVDMLNVHAAGGKEMLLMAREAAEEEAARQGRKPPLLIAVTVLTSLDTASLKEDVGIERSLEEQVVHWALLAQRCGLNGVVASARELEAIRKACGPEFVVVTPGIRPTGATPDDQRRVLTPAEAVRRGATYLVVGRPVLSSPDPVAAVTSILGEIGSI